MSVRIILAAAIALGAVLAAPGIRNDAQAARPGEPSDWHRFYYYPYVYYPQNFQTPQKFDHMYYRYPPERRIPVYNEHWHNFYPSPRPYHSGHAFILDVF